MIYIKDGKRINIYAGVVTEEGVKHPAGWLTNPDNRVAFGVSEVAEPVAPDHAEFYYRQETDVAPYVDYIERPIEELRLQFRRKVNDQRFELERNGFTYQGRKFDSDQASFNRLQVALSMAMIANTANVPYAVDWTTADNSVVTLDANQVLEMAKALAAYGTSLHERARLLKKKIETCKSLAELVALDLDLNQ
jgi:hypothetical protein